MRTLFYLYRIRLAVWGSLFGLLLVCSAFLIPDGEGLVIEKLRLFLYFAGLSFVFLQLRLAKRSRRAIKHFRFLLGLCAILLFLSVLLHWAPEFNFMIFIEPKQLVFYFVQWILAVLIGWCVFWFLARFVQIMGTIFDKEIDEDQFEIFTFSKSASWGSVIVFLGGLLLSWPVIFNLLALKLTEHLAVAQLVYLFGDWNEIQKFFFIAWHGLNAIICLVGLSFSVRYLWCKDSVNLLRLFVKIQSGMVFLLLIEQFTVGVSSFIISTGVGIAFFVRILLGLFLYQLTLYFVNDGLQYQQNPDDFRLKRTGRVRLE